MRNEDFRTPTWKRLTQTLEARLQELRELNDNPSLGIEKTSTIRGGIGEIKKILSLAEQVSLSPAVDPEELLSAGDPASNGQ